MNADNTYNGWTNRETWLVNLHFGETIMDVLGPILDEYTNRELRDDKEIAFKLEETLKEWLKDLVEYETNGLTPFIVDLIDISKIDYLALADKAISDHIANNS